MKIPQQSSSQGIESNNVINLLRNSSLNDLSQLKPSLTLNLLVLQLIGLFWAGLISLLKGTGDVSRICGAWLPISGSTSPVIILALRQPSQTKIIFFNFVYQDKVETAVSDDEESRSELEETENAGLSGDGMSPTPGGPFSALTPSMWPQDILSKLGQLPDDPNSQPDYR